LYCFPFAYIFSCCQQMQLRSIHISPYHFPRGHKLDHPSANKTTAFHSHITLPFPKGTIKSTTRRQTKLLRSVRISPYHFPRVHNIDHPSANATAAFRSNIPYHFPKESLPIHIIYKMQELNLFTYVNCDDRHYFPHLISQEQMALLEPIG